MDKNKNFSVPKQYSGAVISVSAYLANRRTWVQSSEPIKKNKLKKNDNNNKNLVVSAYL